MTPKKSTVARLAAEAEVDLDEALVLLWDAGLNDVDEPTDVIPDRKMATAKRALGLATARQLRSISHLAQAAGLSVEDARARLQEARIITGRTSDRLPKGCVKKARKVLGLQHAGGFSRLVAITSDEPAPQLEPETAEAFEWKTIGSVEQVEVLSAEEVEKIHFAIADDFSRGGDPISPAGIRDQNLLESAVFRPQTAMGDERKYPTVAMAGAAVFHSLALNHAFHNGNKRTALVSLLVFLERNHYVLDVTQNEIFKQVLLVAQHSVVRGMVRPHPDHEVLVISDWICKKMRRIRKDEYPLQWRHLKKVLSSHGCRFEDASKGRITIVRPVRRGRFFGGQKLLKSRPAYADDGRDADPGTVHKIRRDLRLDEEHGFDSDVFYRGRPVIDEFIAKYRKTLIRLAKL